MLDQSIPEQFSWEASLILYFIILVLSTELALFFIIQKATRKERSPTWILAFSVTMFAFSGVYVLRALNDLVFNGSQTNTESLFQADFVILSASAIVIGVLMRIFFKNGKMAARLLSVVVIVLGTISLPLNIYALIVPWTDRLSATALAGGLFVPVASFPIYIAWQLAKQDELGHKKIFIVILLGILIDFIGLGFNFPRVENILIVTLGTAYPAFKYAVLIIIISGSAMMVFGFFFIPPVDDFFWMNQIVALYVLNKTTRTAIFKKTYDQKVVDGFSFSEKKATGYTDSESVFVSGIGGITDILSESAVTDGKNVEQIDQGSVKLLLSYQGELIFMLLVRQSMPVLKFKLQVFKDEFLVFFGDIISRFADKPEKFLPAETIATRVFGTAGERKRWQVQ